MRVTWKEGSFTGDSERYVKEASGNGVSLSFSPPIFLYVGTFKGYLEGRALSLGTLRDMSRKALEKSSFLYSGSVRVTWEDGSFIEDSDVEA